MISPFINAAFSEEERAALLRAPLSDDPLASDRAFLLSAEEIERFLSSAEALSAKGFLRRL
ncbi:MAG: hypothetical protein IJJ85_02325 [Clostridia bacterium]|nr:hypothetical protein [Clostridia bacterium]